MNSALLPSGDIDAGGGPVIPVTFGPHVFDSATPPRPAPPRPPPPPPRPPRPPAPAEAWPPSGGVGTTSRVFFTGSMTTFSVPVSVVRAYQKRPSGSHVGLTVSPTTGTGKDQAATPAQVKAFESELLALNAILRRATGVASPVGFSVETWGYLAGYHKSEHAPGQPAAGKLPIAGGFTFGAFPIFEYQKNGKTVREDTGETALQSFLINQIDASAFERGGVPDWGSLDHDAFLKPMPQGEIAGLPRFGDGLIIARD